MTHIPSDIDLELAKIWLAGQDLRECAPEQVKEMFFCAVRKMEAVISERWD